MVPFDRPYTTFQWSVIVSIALSCIISEIKRDIGQNIAIAFGADKLEQRVYPTLKNKFQDTYNRFDRIPACDRQTDRQTSCDCTDLAMHSIASIVKWCKFKYCRFAGFFLMQCTAADYVNYAYLSLEKHRSYTDKSGKHSKLWLILIHLLNVTWAWHSVRTLQQAFNRVRHGKHPLMFINLQTAVSLCGSLVDIA